MTQHTKISKDILQLLEYAALSPSSHNTQPWVVYGQGDDTLTVGYNPQRQLTVGDPDKRELFISLGCFIETLILAAQEKGYKAEYHYRGNGADNVANLVFAKAPAVKTDFIELIKRRRSDRQLYEAIPLSGAIEKELTSLQEESASLALFTDADDIKFLAEMTHEATFQSMSNPAFRAELASWVRNNWTKKPDGMPAYVQGIPGPVSLIAKVVIKNVSKTAVDQAKKDATRAMHSAAIGLICTKEQNPETWIEAGRLFQRVCLVALKHDIKTAAMSAAIVVPETARQIIERLRLPCTPVAFIRFGYAKGTPKASPRLQMQDFLAP